MTEAMERETFDFSKKGSAKDEVIFEFAEEESSQQLCVCRGVITRASPVFKVMLEGPLQEAREHKVRIEDFNIEDFREFLYCIDPGTLKSVTEQNVLQVVGIAEKYLSSAVVEKCKYVMSQMLQAVQENLSLCEQPSKMLRILKVLIKTTELNYETLTEIGVKSMSVFNCNVYSGTCSKENMQESIWYGKNGKGVSFNQFQLQLLTECRGLFLSLPECVQNQIHKARAMKLEQF